MTPTATVEVIGSRKTIELTAIVDTGFDGDLCVPIRDAVRLGLELVGELPVELADGTQKNELLFGGSARFFSKTHEVRITLTTSEEALIGTRLLNRYPLAIDFPGGQINLRARPTPGLKQKRPSSR
jgi:predicted aspartyl protease